MSLVDHDARIAAANDLDTTFFVEAAAGTGKTTSLVSRIMSVLKKGRARLNEVVAITFTEKAAGELKIRLREAIERELSGEKLRAALSDLDRAHISTIHSFCAWVLRERPVEAAVDPQFAVADEMQTELLLEEAWEQWLESELAANPPALRRALMLDVSLDKLRELAKLLVEQRTRLSSARWPEALPLDVNAVLARLRAVEPTFERCLQHYTSREENAYVRARALLDALPQLDDASEGRKLAVLTTLTLSEPRRKTDFDSDVAFAETKKLIKELKPQLAELTEAANHNLLVALVAWLHGFVTHFQQVKHQSALLDFDDLLMKTRDLLLDHPVVAAQLRERFKFVLVDEFQDTDPVQAELVLLLANDRPGKLFVVGDPKQSIYSFRGADIEMYAKTRRSVEAGGQALTFRQNFRSKSTILDWVNAVFSKIIVKSRDGDYQPDYIALAPDTKRKTDTAAVTLLRPRQWSEDKSLDEVRQAEAAVIARYLRQQVDEGAFRWGDVAMLFRSFTAVETYAEALQQASVPFRVIGGKNYYQRQEIQTLASLLCCLDNPADKLNLIATLRSLVCGWTDDLIFFKSATTGLNYLRDVSAEEDQQVRDTFTLLRELHEQRHESSVAGYVERVVARAKICEAHFVSRPDGAQCVANLLKAVELARQLEAVGVRSVRGFVRRLRQTLLGGVDEEPSPANEETDDVVRLLSMHKAKGLEFPIVILPDLAGRSADSGAKIVPNRTDRTFEIRFNGRMSQGFDDASEQQDLRDEAEEIRLLYVAATRAKERLVLPWFAEKGERLNLLRRGFEPEANELVEVIYAESLVAPPAIDSKKKSGKRAAELVKMRERWRKETTHLLTRATQPVARTSPSRLAGEPESSDEEPSGVERHLAMEFGSVVHEAMEQMNVDPIAASKLGDADKLRATEMVKRALNSELLSRVRKADEAYRELPFTMATGEGLMEGKIDLLFCERGKWVLVDYKTDARAETERYGTQLRAYETALNQVAGIELAEKLLFFLASGTVKRVD
jgi:ATP-dependent helicase/nuclease subunit A